MLFDLFKKKQKKTPDFDFSSIKVDLHSHLIPAIDDGSQSLEDSIDLILQLKSLGFEKIITTPHIMADFYRNTPEIINKGLDIMREELAKQNINIEINAAAEYYLDETLEAKVEKKEVLTLGNDFLLFEISFVNCPASFFDIIKKMQDKGYKPVLAHPERYPFFAGSIENFQKIKETGCYLQLNTISLTGYYGKPTQKTAEELVDKYLIDFIGSDMHHDKHASALRDALTFPYVERLVKDYQLQNILLYD